MRQNKELKNLKFLYLPTYPGVPQAVAITPESSILDNPKSLIIILLSSSVL